jgi:Ran GTPase-activating protein (RanGAP) involved in mRNA processing and transport
MPVEQSEKDSLAPFFAHLRNGGTHERSSTVSAEDAVGASGIEPYYNTELIEFEKGVLYADGRIDLCKMVTGPRNIGDLMESLKPNTFSKHFLLGNNIVGPTGAKAIAEFIEEFPERFETWYLAGNCIDGAGFRVLVDAMVKSPAITNAWLKRNPLDPGAAPDVFRLITQTPNLRTLDLDQTELGDVGVAELFNLLAKHVPAKPLTLRHIYMNACGIGEAACKAIAQYLQSQHCTIESLYLSNNPIGNSVTHLATGLESNKSLKRLVLQSCGLKDDGVIALAESLNGNEQLTALDVGQAYATEDLGMRFNWITEDSASALAELIRTTKLQYLNISYTPMVPSSLNGILEAVANSNTLLWFFAKPLVTGGTDPVSVKAGQEYARLYKLARERLHANVKEQYDVDYLHFENEHKRFLISPKDVRFIDSVYRNRDAAAARRGLKKLDKWWDEGDETLQRVQDGTLI